MVINIFKYFSSCSHCIQDLAHRVGWRSTCIRNICKNWKNSCHLKVALWRFAPDFGLLQNSHTGKIYTKQYCIFLESDFVSTFYFTSTFYWSLPLALGTSGNLQKCNMAQLGNCIARLHHITRVVRMTRNPGPGCSGSSRRWTRWGWSSWSWSWSWWSSWPLG